MRHMRSKALGLGAGILLGASGPAMAQGAPKSPAGGAPAPITIKTDPLVFHGTGSLGLPTGQFKTVTVNTAPLVFHGTGTLGLPTGSKAPIQIKTDPLVFHGTGKL